MKTDTLRKWDILRTKYSVNNTQGFMHRNLRFQNAIELSLWPSWHTIRHTTGMSMDRILVVFCDPHYLERKANIFLSSPKIVSIFWLIFVNRLPAHTLTARWVKRAQVVLNSFRFSGKLFQRAPPPSPPAHFPFLKFFWLPGFLLCILRIFLCVFFVRILCILFRKINKKVNF